MAGILPEGMKNVADADFGILPGNTGIENSKAARDRQLAPGQHV